MPHVIDVFENLKWHSESDTVLNEDLNCSSLFANYTHRSVDDGFTGDYKGVKFCVSETILRRVEGLGKYRNITNVFRGVVIMMDANKDIKSKTIVTSKNDINASNVTLGYLTSCVLLVLSSLMFFVISIYYILAIVIIIAYLSIVYKLSHKESFELVNLEDPSFGTRFSVYLSDQVEARYLVTPSFMERFNNLKTSFGAKNIKCSFYDDKLVIAISASKDLFEIGNIFRLLSNLKNIQNFYDELASIYSLIDSLQFDEKLVCSLKNKILIQILKFS